MGCNTAYAPFQEISLNNLKDIEVKYNVFNTFVHYYQCCYLTYSAPFSISKNAWNCLNDLSMLSRTLSSKKSCLETTKRNSTTYLSNRLFKEIAPNNIDQFSLKCFFFSSTQNEIFRRKIHSKHTNISVRWLNLSKAPLISNATICMKTFKISFVIYYRKLEILK